MPHTIRSTCVCTQVLAGREASGSVPHDTPPGTAPRGPPTCFPTRFLPSGVNVGRCVRQP